MNIMMFCFLYIKKSFLGVIMAIFSLYFTDGLAKDISSKKNDQGISISSYCDDSLQWYDDHPKMERGKR